MKYTLTATPKGNKGLILYTVTDEAGKVISSRTSARTYVACTIDGSYYFGRLDLVGKGDHGNRVKYCQGHRWDPKTSKFVPGMAAPIEPTPIAYLENGTV